MGILLCIVCILFIAACIGAIVLGSVFYCKSKRSNTPAAKTPTAPVRSSPVKTPHTPPKPIVGEAITEKLIPDSPETYEESAEAPVQPEIVICTHCGNELPGNFEFGLHCGRPVIKKLICKNCRNELPPNSSFCNKCGTPV